MVLIGLFFDLDFVHVQLGCFVVGVRLEESLNDHSENFSLTVALLFAFGLVVAEPKKFDGFVVTFLCVEKPVLKALNLAQFFMTFSPLSVELASLKATKV